MMEGKKMEIKPFTGSDEDYRAVFQIDSAAFPDYLMSESEWRHEDQMRPAGRFFHRDLILQDGSPVAFGDYGQSADPEKYFVYITFHPEKEEPSLRRAYLEHVLAVLQAHKPAVLLSGALSSHEWVVRFLEANGFEEVMREPSSLLEVASFDWAVFTPVFHQVEAAGIRILPLGVLLDRDPEAWRKLHTLYEELLADVPSRVPFENKTFEAFVQHFTDDPGYNPASCFIALDGESFVGMCRGRRNVSDEGQVVNGITGVLAAYRRRKIATAMKIALIRYARETGVASIITFNEAGNPMYQLNLALGFKPQPAWISFERQLQKPG
jgi:ribosomal protein S18 acetylase RimI-like enzyme